MKDYQSGYFSLNKELKLADYVSEIWFKDGHTACIHRTPHKPYSKQIEIQANTDQGGKRMS